jgi:hypothetical protein
VSGRVTQRAHGGRRDERGETLVEILIGVTILGLAVTGLIGGFLAAIMASSTYRSIADADTVVRTAVDSITSQMQQNDTASFWCPLNLSASWYQVGGLPSGYTATVTSVQYWVRGSQQITCAAQAPQVITLAVTYTDRRGAKTPRSATFTVSDPLALPVQAGGTATQLVFLSSGGPSDSTAGSALPNQPLVAVEDASGNVVTTDLSPVSLAITTGTGTPGAILANCTGSEFYGVVNFGGCEIDLAGRGYTLTASNGNLAPGTSRAFTVSPGPPTKLVFTMSPVTAPGAQASTGGLPFGQGGQGSSGQQPVVTVFDAYGNVVTGDTSTVTLAITSGTGASGATLTCNGASEQQSASAGVASFSGCAIDAAGNGYTLTATDGSLTPATSLSFAIATGPAAQLAFTTQPGGRTVHALPFQEQPVVTVKDAGGNTVTGDSSTVTLAITAATGTAGAHLTCNPSTNQRAARNGVASFSGCSIDLAGNGYSLTASDAALTPATSQTFNVG